MKNLTYCIAILILLNSCKDDNTTPTDMITVKGLTYGASQQDFINTDASLVSTLESIGPIRIVAQVNHTANAASVDLELNNTKVIIFGNPALGTPLMQKNPLVGLDLPQKLFVFQDDQEKVRVAFNNVSYLKARHGLDGVEALNTIEGALNNFASGVSDGELVSITADSITEGEGIITKISTLSVQEGYEALITAINNNPNLRLVAEVDHQANAASIGEQLNPIKLIIFGNPKLGTPLMQNAQTTGIDLPQKILIWDDGMGSIRVSYNDPQYLRNRHGITGNDDILTTITGALNNLSDVAAGL